MRSQGKGKATTKQHPGQLLFQGKKSGIQWGSVKRTTFADGEKGAPEKEVIDMSQSMQSICRWWTPSNSGRGLILCL